MWSWNRGGLKRAKESGREKERNKLPLHVPGKLAKPNPTLAQPIPAIKLQQNWPNSKGQKWLNIHELIK